MMAPDPPNDRTHNLTGLIAALSPQHRDDLERRFRWQAAASESWCEQVLLCLADIVAASQADQLGRSPQTHGEIEHTE